LSVDIEIPKLPRCDFSPCTEDAQHLTDSEVYRPRKFVSNPPTAFWVIYRQTRM